MAFPVNPIASCEFSIFGKDWVYRVFENDNDPGAGNDVSFIIEKKQGISQVIGANKFDPAKHIHPTQELFTILDVDSFFINTLKGRNPRDFRLDVLLDGVLVNRYSFLTEVNQFEISSFSPSLPVVAYDGLSLLASDFYEESGLKTLYDLFNDIFSKTGHDLPVKMLFDLSHINVDGTWLPDLTRLPVNELVDLTSGRVTYLDVLKATLELLELHVFQCNGAWHIQQIDLKNAENTVFEWDSGVKTTSDIDNSLVKVGNWLKGSQKRTIKGLSPLVITYNSEFSNAGGVLNGTFESWNSGDTIPDYWSVTGLVEPNSTTPDSGLKITGLATANQSLERLFTPYNKVDIQIDGTLKAAITGAGPYVVPVCQVKLISLEGGVDYWVRNSPDFDTETTIQDLTVNIGAITSGDIYSINISGGVAIPAGFTGFIQVSINTSFTFDPNEDSTNEFGEMVVTSLQVSPNNVDDEKKPVFTYSKEINSIVTAYNVEIGDYLGKSFNDCVQFKHALGWFPSYNWGDNKTLNDLRAARILEAFPHSNDGFIVELNPSVDALRFSNAFIVDGKPYNPYYILYNKVKDLLTCALYEIEVDTAAPTREISYI